MSRRRYGIAPTPLADETLDAVSARIGLPPWDVLLWTDGSTRRGIGGEDAIGLGAIVVERHPGMRWPISGGVSWGKPDLAELLAQQLALSWLVDCRNLLARVRRKLGRRVRVLIVTDARHLAQIGRGDGSPHGAAVQHWRALRGFAELPSLELDWFWIPRNSVAMAELTDAVSVAGREATLTPARMAAANARAHARADLPAGAGLPPARELALLFNPGTPA